MTPEHSVKPSTDARPQRHPSYYKAGTIERFVQWRGVQDGKRLPFTSKIIGVALLGHAQSSRGFTCIVPEPELCDELAMDPKTFRKYLKPLVEFGLVKTDRAREGASKRYDCSEIYKRFGEPRAEPQSKVTQLPQSGTASSSEQSGTTSRSVDAEREAVRGVREDVPGGTGYDGRPDRDTVPDSINERSSSPSVISSLLDVSAPAARLGLSNTEGIEREVVTIDEVLTRWNWLRREQRRVVKRFGIVAVAGAIGYVLQQDAARPNTIENPAGLFRYALKHGHAAELPNAYTGTTSRSAPVKGEQARVTPGIDGALRTYLEARLSSAVYDAFLKHARIDVSGANVTVECANEFSAEFLRTRHAEKLGEAARAVLGREDVTVLVRVEGAVAE